MKHYTHLTPEQRHQTHALLKSKTSKSEIARIIGVHKSTITRELKRNTGKRGYRPKQAQAFASQRKAKIVNALPISAGLMLTNFCFVTIHLNRSQADCAI